MRDDSRVPRTAGARRLLSGQFLLLMAASGVFFAGFGVLNALVPPYVVDELGGSEATAGMVMGSFAITSLLSRPYLGRMADRRGARHILVIGAWLSVLSMLVLRVAPVSVTAVVASRLVLGAAGAAMFTGSTLLSITLAPADRRGQAASLLLVSVHAGLGIGPIIGLRIADGYGYDGVWTAVAVAAALSALMLGVLRRAPTRPAGRPAPLIHRAALLPGVVTYFGVFAFNGFITFASLYGREVGITDVALLFTAASGTIVVVRLTAGHIPDRIGPVRAGTAALVVTAGSTMILALWPTPVGAFVGAIVLAAGLSLQTPAFLPLAVADVPEQQQGAAMATFTGFYDLANATIGPIMGLIIAGVGYAIAFATAGSMALVALIILHVAIAPGGREIRAAGRVAPNPSSR